MTYLPTIYQLEFYIIFFVLFRHHAPTVKEIFSEVQDVIAALTGSWPKQKITDFKFHFHPLPLFPLP